MSYAAPKRLSKRATMFYPNTLKVYEFENPMTQKMEPVFKNTRPYEKDVQGETKDDIRKYLAHTVDLYQEQRNKYIKDGLKEIENEVL